MKAGVGQGRTDVRLLCTERRWARANANTGRCAPAHTPRTVQAIRRTMSRVNRSMSASSASWRSESRRCSMPSAVHGVGRGGSDVVAATGGEGGARRRRRRRGNRRPGCHHHAPNRMARQHDGTCHGAASTTRSSGACSMSRSTSLASASACTSQSRGPIRNGWAGAREHWRQPRSAGARYRVTTTNITAIAPTKSVTTRDNASPHASCTTRGNHTCNPG